MQRVKLAAVLFRVHLPDGCLESGDHLLAVLGTGNAVATMMTAMRTPDIGRAASGERALYAV